MASLLCQLHCWGRNTPGVDLRRPAALDPQSPTDRSFVAAVLRLAPGLSRCTVEMNVDHRHVVVTTETLRTLTLLGVDVGVNLDGGSVIGQGSEKGSGEEGESAETREFGAWVVETVTARRQGR